MKLTLMNKNGKYTSNTPEVLMTKNVHDFLSKEKNSPVQKEIDLILPEIKKFPLTSIIPLGNKLEWHVTNAFLAPSSTTIVPFGKTN